MAFTVPGYQVEQLVGYGSHAEVWSGRTAGTGEPVALKRIILPGQGEPHRAAELIRSGRAEAALLTALEHPSLIRLLQYVQTPAAVVLVMEPAKGGSLAQLLRRRDRLSPAEVAAALSPIAAALAYAHAEGVLHGDVSAANILFTSTGQPKLADLGVARMLIGHAGADRSLGTPAYVDPVVAAGGAAGAASDVFSLAAVALHCLTGAGPWQCGDRADLRAVLERAATGVITDLAGKLAGCPEAMVTVLSRALDPEPHRRGSAAEFALDLGASVPSAPVVLAAGRIGPRVGRHSAEQAPEPGADAVPADLTHVARLQVRPEPAEPRPAGRPARRLLRVSAIVAVAVLVSTGIGVGVLAVRGGGWPTLAAGQRPSPAPVTPAVPSGSAGVIDRAEDRDPAKENPDPADPDPTDPTEASAADVKAAQARAAEARAAEARTAEARAAEAKAVLERLADRRAEAFALGLPELLAGVYQSPALLAQDRSQLDSRIPAGCGLIGPRTQYRDVTVLSARPQQLELQVTASQPPASLVCAGAVRSRTLPAAPARLALSLVRVGAEFRIASQRPGGS
jgi:hypothetical protein